MRPFSGTKLFLYGLLNTTVFLVSLILNLVLFSKITFAATYNWIQTDWSSGSDTSGYAQHDNNQTGWTKFYSKESSLKLDSGLVTLDSTTAVVTHNSSGDFTSGTTSSTAINASGQIQLSMFEGNVSIDGGSDHTCASTADGSAYCWGQNSSGQLGNNSTTQSLLPTQVKGPSGVGYISGIKQISAGNSYTCAVKDDGTVWCWGLGSYGRLGNGGTSNQSSPVQVKGVGNTGFLSNIAKVATGESHTCAISNDGYAYCWGYGAFGPLGNNGTSNYNYPVQVIDSSGSGYLSDLIDISTSDRYTCAVKSTGTGWCWGLGNWGQIGNGTQTESNLIPKQVSTVTTFKQIHAGIHGHSCGVTTDKKAYCWGWGDYGSIGSGSSPAYQTRPAQVTGITDAEEASAGYYHSCVVRSNGNVACWGGGDDGQLGDGTNTHTINTYVTVSNLTDAVKITNGANHSCALKADGSVVCWGNGGGGRLGRNSTANSNIPVNSLNSSGSSQLFLTGFADQGTFTSSAINLNTEGGLFSLSLGLTEPSGTSVKLELKTAASESDLTNASWFGASGNGTYFTDPSYSVSPSIPLLSYVQYRATLETSDSLTTPLLGLVSFKYQTFSPSGFLISSPYDSQTNETLVSGVSWIKSTPSNTSVKFQLRTGSDLSDLNSNSWVGPDGTSSTFFTNNLGNTTPDSFKDQSADRWFQYKTFLETSNRAFSPSLYDTTITYVINAPPQFDSTYQTNGFGITRDVTPGIFNFLYKVRDVDTDQGSIGNQYQLWPSFQYTIDGGSTWNTITTGQLTGYNTDNPITLPDNSTYVEAATVWDARSVLPNTFTTMQVRAIVDDHEAANNTTAVTSDAFYFDTKNPLAGSVEGGGTGININHNQVTSLSADKTNNRNVTLYFSATDDSDLQVKYSSNSSLSGAVYQDYVSSVGFTLPSNDGTKTVYAQFKDIYGNETNIYSDTIELDTTSPNNPSPLFSKDVSNANNNEYRIFINWPKGTDTDWSGYKIYSLNGGSFSLDQTITNVDTNYLIKDNLTNLTEYSFKVTAFDDLGNESVGSTVIQSTGSSPSDSTPPQISGVGITGVSTNSATIFWSTDETATSTILYSLTDNNFEETKGIDGYTLSHSVTVSGLSANTQYFYKIRSLDSSGNTAETSVASFSTLSADTTGPIISSVTSSNITSSGATITFTTDESADSFIEYSTQSGFSQGDIFGQADSVTSHTISLRSLSPSTTYYYKIRSSDLLSNQTVSTEYSFTTQSDPSDTTGPVISGVTVSDISYNSATISFSTNETATSFVEYGLDTNYGQIFGNNTDETSHSIDLPETLTPQSDYYFRIRARDTSGNETIGIGYTFTTLANPNDSTPPVISQVAIGTPLQNSVTVSWQTNESATSYVGFSTDNSYSSEQGNPSLVTDHSVTLIGLNPGTTYFLRIKSSDSVGNITFDNNSGSGFTFTTSSGHNPPVISSVTSDNIATDSAKITWNTDTSSNSFVEYWLNENSIFWYGNNNLTQTHTVTLSDLLSQSTYYYRVRSKDSSDAESVSSTGSFTTLNLETGTTTPPSGSVDLSDEDSILDKIKNGTVEFVKKVIGAISDSSISEDDLTDSLNSMTPKIISSPSISSNNIIVEPGVDNITITWVTDKKSNSIVAYVPEDQYDSASDNPYTTVIGNPDEWVTNHSVAINNLDPNTVYHYQVRSKSEYGDWTKSNDFTFTTLSIDSKIQDLHFSKIGQNFVTAIWSTSFESRSAVKIIDPLTDKSVVSFEEKGFDRTHEFTTDILQNSTSYQMEITTIAKDGTVSDPLVFPFSTTTSSDPPEISNVRISNALISGAVEQVQTIISWKTNKPSTSRIVYNEGMGKDFNQSTSLDKSLVTDHVVVTTNLKPGKVYTFKAESIDAAENSTLSKDFLIMTPKPQQSVLDLIIDNFASSFSFITGGKK